MTLLEKMDRAVYATGIDRIIFRKLKPRTLRWTPLFVLAALIIGYGLIVSSEPTAAHRQPLLDGRFLVGIPLFFGSYLLAMLVRLSGPRIVPAFDQPLDERELIIRARANAMSGTVLVIAAMAGCFYMGVATLLGWWQPQSPMDWMYLALALQAGFLALQTLFASWMQPRPVADDEE